MRSHSLHKIAKYVALKTLLSAVLKPFDIQRHIARLWKALIHTNTHTKPQGCAKCFWAFLAALFHIKPKGPFGLLS